MFISSHRKFHSEWKRWRSLVLYTARDPPYVALSTMKVKSYSAQCATNMAMWLFQSLCGRNITWMYVSSDASTKSLVLDDTNLVCLYGRKTNQVYIYILKWMEPDHGLGTLCGQRPWWPLRSS